MALNVSEGTVNVSEFAAMETDADLINPATGAVFQTRAEPTSLAETDAAIERSRGAFDGVASGLARRPGPTAAALRRARRRPHRGTGRAGGARTPVTPSATRAGRRATSATCWTTTPARRNACIGTQIPVSGGVDMTFHEPLGVVGIIVPWNFPMPIAGWGFAPALAAGNTVVLKPAEVTPLTALRTRRAGARRRPAGGRLHGAARPGSVVGQRFVTHPAVRKVCFTGSTEVGKQIMAGCADQVKRVTLELGGKSAEHRLRRRRPREGGRERARRRVRQRRPGLLRALADPGRGIGRTTRFMALLEPAVTAFRCEDPTLESAQMGPLITAAQRGLVAGYVDAAPVAFRGSCPGRRRFLVRADRADRVVAATRRTGARRSSARSSRCCRSATRTRRSGWPTTPNTGCPARCGPATSGRALRVARAVETGTLSVNSHSSVRYWTPFGGVKQSGLGRELGPDALHAFTDVKNVFIATDCPRS